MERKKFLKQTLAIGLVGSAGLINSCKNGDQYSENHSPNIITNKKYKWTMVTTWPPNFPVLGEACTLFADWVHQMSNGQMTIKVYGAGELIPAFECFDAVNSGAAEIANGAAYYWAGKASAFPFFTTYPFGLNAQQINAWMYGHDGHSLYKELYASYGLIPYPAGNTGMQMAGWFNKEINTKEDFKGLKMRIPGLGAKVISKAGATPILSSGNELYTNLERGVIDAAEWIGPYHDYIMGFHRIAKYYYAPGWHETGSLLENVFNMLEFNKLPNNLKVILETASARMNLWVLSEFEAKNNIYLQKILDESDVKIKNFDVDVLSYLKSLSLEVTEELKDSDAFTKKVIENLESFKKSIKNWSSYSEALFYAIQ